MHLVDFLLIRYHIQLPSPNVLAHRSRASNAPHGTARSSRDSVQPACWAKNQSRPPSSLDLRSMAFSISYTLFIACFRALGAKPCACCVQYTSQRFNSSTPIVSKRFSKSLNLKKYAMCLRRPTAKAETCRTEE